MLRTVFTVTYLGCLALMTFVGLCYGALTPGLASRSSGGPFYCSELLSSGSDDSAMIFAFSLLSIPLLLRIIRLNRGVSISELVVFGGCATTTVSSLWLASLDCASILYTAFVIPDPLLGGALIALPASLISLVWLRVTQ